MRRWLLRAAVVVAVLGAVVALRATVLSKKAVPVEVVKVERGRVEWTITNSKAGTVRARRRARLSTEIGGRVVRIPVREGDHARAGDPVVELEATSQRAQLDKALKERSAAQARSDEACLASAQAQRELGRFAELSREQMVSESSLDRLQSEAQARAAACIAARATVESVEAGVRLIEAELGKAVLRMPFDGVIADIHVEVGEWATPSPPAMALPSAVEVIDPSSIYVSAPMDEVDSARIRTGQRVRVTLDPFPDVTYGGVVSRVAAYVLDLEAQNRTVEIEVELEDHEVATALLPGTSADVEVILEAHDDVLRVPSAALMEGGGVLVLDGGALREIKVEPGLRNWDFTEVESGLEPGMEVVTSLDRQDVVAGARAVASHSGS